MQIIISSKLTYQDNKPVLAIHADPAIEAETTRLNSDFQVSLELLWQAEELQDKNGIKKYKQEVGEKEDRLSTYHSTNWRRLKEEIEIERARYEETIKGEISTVTIIYA